MKSIISDWPIGERNLSSPLPRDHVAIKLRQSPGSDASQLSVNIFPPLYIHEFASHIVFWQDSIMSVRATSTNMLRRALAGARSATSVPEAFARPAAFSAYRNVSSASRLPTLTASETRRRPMVRPHQQPVVQNGVNGMSPTSKRTIFIQTENTPNPDVCSNTLW